MDICAVLRGQHHYLDNGPMLATVTMVAATPEELDNSRPPKTLWTVERICTACHKAAVFDQDGAEVPNATGKPTKMLGTGPERKDDD